MKLPVIIGHLGEQEVISYKYMIFFFGIYNNVTMYCTIVFQSNVYLYVMGFVYEIQLLLNLETRHRSNYWK